MKKEFIRYYRFFIGIICCSLGIILILKSNLGLSPWDVLNQGLSLSTNITLGRANTVVGFFAILVSLKFKQPIGSGTILNLFLVGEFLNFINFLLKDFSIINSSLFIKLIFFIVGVLIFSYGCFLYISTGLGCGPRDGLLVALTKTTKYSLRTLKTMLEAIALFFGFLLGGHVGIGTIIFTFIVGPCIQYFFKINKINVNDIYHRSLKEEFILLANFLKTNI